MGENRHLIGPIRQKNERIYVDLFGPEREIGFLVLVNPKNRIPNSDRIELPRLGSGESNGCQWQTMKYDRIEVCPGQLLLAWQLTLSRTMAWQQSRPDESLLMWHLTRGFTNLMLASWFIQVSRAAITQNGVIFLSHLLVSSKPLIHPIELFGSSRFWIIMGASLWMIVIWPEEHYHSFDSL